MDTLKYILFLTLFLMGGSLFSQEEEMIPWTVERKLEWTDFKGKPFKTAWAAAVTASGITYQFSSVVENGNVNLDINISTFFYPTESWFQPKLANGVILSHEQLHFDISELFARKMRKRVDEATFTKNVKSEIKKIYRDVLKELSAFQKKYDYETNFSRNLEKQLEWNEQISEALQK